jgi:3-carboxy-cis,cis-muconate cycloisomerase
MMAIGMFQSYMTSYCFSAAGKAIWSDSATLQTWLDVEVVLARAQAKLGMIPELAAQQIAECAQADLFNLDELARGIAHAQHPLMPVLHAFERLCGDEAARFLHWGATTQNVLDTAIALQMRRNHQLLDSELAITIDTLSALALAHKDTPSAGRTHGQHALPTTFGCKIAVWVDELERHRSRLSARVGQSFPTLLGGAIGTYGATGKQGREVEVLVAEALGLEPNPMPSRASYDRPADYVLALGLLAATTEKIAKSVVTWMRTEIGEVAEAFHLGKIGSSTMAQKRNPNTAMTTIGHARLLRSRVPLLLEAMIREDEGDGASSFVTDVSMPEIGIIALSMTEFLARLCTGLSAKPEAMHRNLGLTDGLIASETAMMALGQQIGRHRAHHILYEAAQQTQSDGVPFLKSIQEHPDLQGFDLAGDLAIWLDPKRNLGESSSLVEETVNRVQEAMRKRED